MDFKKKYIKYKMKYLNLLGGTKLFLTKKNNGSDGSSKYSNQCMWISIIDFLNGVLGNDFNLDVIRAIGSNNNTVINGPKKQFDTDTNLRALLNVASIFDLQIHMYVSFRNKSYELVISDEPNWIIGNYSASNVVSIVSYGGHFELITSIGSRTLYGGKIVDSSAFIPNRDLAIGKTTELMTQSQLKEIDDILSILSNYDCIILNLEQNIKKNNLELENLEKSFMIDELNINKDDEQIQIASVSSFQEYKMFLERIIDEFKKELEEIKSHYENYQRQLNILIG